MGNQTVKSEKHEVNGNIVLIKFVFIAGAMFSVVLSRLRVWREWMPYHWRFVIFLGAVMYTASVGNLIRSLPEHTIDVLLHYISQPIGIVMAFMFIMLHVYLAAGMLVSKKLIDSL